MASPWMTTSPGKPPSPGRHTWERVNSGKNTGLSLRNIMDGTDSITNDAGMESWPSREFAEALGYGDYRNFEGAVGKAKLAWFNSGHRIKEHFVDVTEMIEIGKGGQRAAIFEEGSPPSPHSFVLPVVTPVSLDLQTKPA